MNKKISLQGLSRFLYDIKNKLLSFESSEGENSVILKNGENIARGQLSIATGYNSETGGDAETYKETSGTDESAGAYAHAEGNSTIARGDCSHAEGRQTLAKGRFAHAEGNKTIAGDNAAHAEGNQTTSTGNSSHSEGYQTNASNRQAHAEGRNTIADGVATHAEGYRTIAHGDCSHTEGQHTKGIGAASHAEGVYSEARGDCSHAETGLSVAEGSHSHAEGYWTIAHGNCSHAEIGAWVWEKVTISGEAGATSYTGVISKYPTYYDGTPERLAVMRNIFGNSYIIAPWFSAASGTFTVKITSCTLSDNGDGTLSFTITTEKTLKEDAAVDNEQVDISGAMAYGTYSHLEGGGTAYGARSHVEGRDCYTLGTGAHAEGHHVVAAGEGSHGEGFYVETKNFGEHAEGQYNKSNKKNNGTAEENKAGSTQHSIGVGDENTRKNAVEVMQNGDVYVNGIGGYDGTNPESAFTLQNSINGYEEITWSALNTKRDVGELEPGKQYRITDYNCTTVQANTQSANHQFDIIVVADDNHTLNENARACLHEGDTYFSNAGAKLEAWELKYDLDNDTTKYAWADATNGKGVIYWMKDEWNNECSYDFKNIQFARYEQTNPVGYVFDTDEWDYVVDSDQSWVSKYNLKAGLYSLNGSSNDIMLFYDGDLDEYKKKISYTVSSVPTYCYTFGRGLDASLGTWVFGNVIKEYYSSNKWQLNNVVFLQTTLSQYCYSNTFGNNCHSNTFMNNCISNTFECGFNYNTFGRECHFNTFREECNSNTFGNRCDSNTFGNSCSSNIFGYSCSSNKFGNFCDSNAFGDYCTINTFGNTFYFNIFGNNCSLNVFLNNCYSNIFGNSCSSNIFGDYCSSNTFGLNCSSNTFVFNCYSNTFGDLCGFNIFGNSCHSNTFGEWCDFNTFGNSCNNIKFGTSSTVKSYCSYNIVESGNQYIYIDATGTTSDSNPYRNIKICQGVNNTTTYKTITDSNVGQTFQTVYQPFNSQVVNV